jgi:hypothetical protein
MNRGDIRDNSRAKVVCINNVYPA